MRTFVAVMAAACAIGAQATLYGISQTVFLETIDPSSGAASPVGPAIPYELQAQGLSSMDPKNGVYYLVGFNGSSTKANLCGIDTKTGKLVTDMPLPFAESAFVGVGQTIDVDPSDGNVFAGGRLVATGPHTVGKLDVTTGKYTVIAQINSTDLPVLGASSTFDPDSRQLFVQFGIQASGQIENFAINVDTKNVTLIPEDPEEGRIITTMAYDPKRKLVLGLGVKPFNGTIERTLVTLDPVTKVISTVANVQTWLIESGGESALDPESRTLYWIGQPDGAKPTDPFHLVGLDADTGAAKDTPDLCPNDAACPWSIAVLNA